MVTANILQNKANSCLVFLVVIYMLVGEVFARMGLDICCLFEC